MTPEQLQGIVSAAVAETIKALKTPTEVEQIELDKKLQEIKTANEDRKKLSQEVLNTMEGKRRLHFACSHEHSDGSTRCIRIQEKNGPGYMLCLWNQCIIRPGAPPKKFDKQGKEIPYQGSVIYDTNLFNRIFQKLPGRADINV